MSEAGDRFVRAARLAELQANGRLTVQIDRHNVCLFAYDDNKIVAVDNRCPHMGFPLDRGTVQDGILTCHWHHARFDLASGGTFDPWADDVPTFPIEVRDGEVWVSVTPQRDPRVHQRERLRDGLERDISLVIAKAVIKLLDMGVNPTDPFRVGLDFGTHYRQAGWGQGLTIHTCMLNLLRHLRPADQPRALFHGLSAVAAESAGEPPRFMLNPLPGNVPDFATLKRWFRRFIEVRDDEGAERCVVSALRAGADDRQMADMLFAAATDHRYIQIGHVADFTNKAFEALDAAGWEHAEPVLTSLIPGYARASRMEESNAWRNPVDLIAILGEAFEQLPAAVVDGRNQRGSWSAPDKLASIVLADDPAASVAALLSALQEGATEEQLAQAVACAAALRIAHFHTSNEFGDWDTALHTFTFANAIHQGLRRAPSVELLRGVFDAAMSVYLDRFLNIPAAPLPQGKEHAEDPTQLLAQLPDLLDRQQRVDEAATVVADFLHAGSDAAQLLAMLGRLLLREDRDFHTLQMVEAAFQQHTLMRGTPAATHFLIAAARYLAAHAPTVRAQDQTYEIAHRLHQGERLYEG
jgi:nitrite reductase/ring-hydroxylating ferredoxin subunit